MNIFDFIDYLQSTGFTGGTANENRYFLFTTLDKSSQATDDYDTVRAAYESIGVTFPDKTFARIFDAYADNTGPAYFIQHMAPNSIIPDIAYPVSDFDQNTNYVAYSEITVYNKLADITTVENWYHYYDDEYTPSELKREIARSAKENSDKTVITVNILRAYKRS